VFRTQVGSGLTGTFPERGTQSLAMGDGEAISAGQRKVVDHEVVIFAPV